MKLEQFDKIYILVSGGIDSTYLYEKLKRFYKEKIYPVNCFNPYEQNKTLKQIAKDPNFIQIKSKGSLNYGEILKEAFMNLPKAYKLKKEKKYHKKIFPCCYHIKHKHFLKQTQFKEDNVVIISGIKRGDGKQRRIWLTQMSKGTHARNSNGEATFFHRHLTGMLYCYPFRDYNHYELSDISIRRLKKKYPKIKHSGCSICPVLVLFNLINEGIRYYNSVNYAQKLGVLENQLITKYIK